MKLYRNLNLDLIKEKIIEFASIVEAKEYIRYEEVSFNPLIIKNNLLLTSEALSILNHKVTVHFDGIENCSFLFEKANKGICLEGIELIKLLSFHNHCERIKKQFTQFDVSLAIRDYSDSINLNHNVFSYIEKYIDPSGIVKEDATDRLRQINADLNNCEKDLYNRAHSFIDKHMSSLQEPSIYFRNDRVTFLIKNSDKNKYSGYVYGSSSSGLASYVEPASFIEVNNKKLTLSKEKEDEINRILIDLSYRVSSVKEDYEHNFDSLMKLNVIFAKAMYGFVNHGVMANIIDEKAFEIIDLCHPLIDMNKVVSNTYRLCSPYQGIVISGSNTGGKTVSLKAIGLTILMSYLGIPVIARKAQIPIYSNVYVDIDDNQSIEDSLSTFSAHISNINSILNVADCNSLILIDELISGTDPKEAQAISLSILETILEKKSSFIITTHFDDIKNYAYKENHILLSSVGFDMETLCPTYHYLENSVGTSNAIDIASRYFDDPSIIEKARYFLNLNKSYEEILISKLSKEIEENELKNKKLDSLYLENQELQKKLNSQIENFEKEKSSLKQEYIDRLNNELEEIKNQALEKLKEIKSNQDEKIVSNIENLKIEENTLDIIEKVELKVNDNVRIKDNEQVGLITSIQGDNVVVDVRGIKIKTKLSELTWMPKVLKQKTTITKPKQARVSNELNIVGQRVEDGLVLLDEYIDKALTCHMHTVKIIHGIGSGALRSAVRNRLKKNRLVKSIKDGDFYDGGSAVTMVEFK